MNRSEILVSVIIPNYNHARYLKQRIDSVLQQSYRNFEIIILDDCSTDDSKNIIESYRHNPQVCQIVYNEINSGTTFKQWQKGLELAKGRFIWIAESDDYCENSFLETAVNRLDEDENLKLFFTRSYQVNEEGQIISNTLEWSADRPDYNWEKNFEENGRVFIKKCMVQSNIIVNASGVVFRKSAVTDSVFSTIIGLRKMGDWLFWTSCIVHGSLAYHGKQPLNYFREHQQSTRYLPNLQAVLVQKVEKYFVQMKIQQILKDLSITEGVRKAHWEMIMMTPVSEYKLLKQTLYNITGIKINFSTYLYYKTFYTLQHNYRKIAHK